jgi:hypothetical protein
VHLRCTSFTNIRDISPSTWSWSFYSSVSVIVCRLDHEVRYFHESSTGMDIPTTRFHVVWVQDKLALHSNGMFRADGR